MSQVSLRMATSTPSHRLEASEGTAVVEYVSSAVPVVDLSWIGVHSCDESVADFRSRNL